MINSGPQQFSKSVTMLKEHLFELENQSAELKKRIFDLEQQFAVSGNPPTCSRAWNNRKPR